MSSPFDHFDYKNGSLACEDVPLSKIADATGSPVYVYSSKAFLTSLAQLQKGLTSVSSRIHFALKSNSNLALVKLMVDAGAGIDIVSGGELFRALRAGTPADRIVFSGVGKTPGEMKAALDAGIYSFNVESSAELAVLNHVATELGRKAPVALRFNPDVDAKTHPYISTGLKRNKFGIHRKEILDLARSIDAYSGISLQGISIHIGSQLLSLKPLDDAFKRLRELVEDLDGILTEPLRFVDLGGGVGIRYNKENPPKIADYCKLIVKHFGPKSKLRHPLEVLLEPGRSISGNAGVLVTEVLYRKARGKKQFVVVDAGMNDLMRPSLYGSYHGIVPVEKSRDKGARADTDIVGPVCESSDCFASGRKFPLSVGQGDLLAILSAGAYGFTMAGQYNSRPRPPEVLVQGGTFRVIRDRESYEDLIRGEHL